MIASAEAYLMTGLCNQESAPLLRAVHMSVYNRALLDTTLCSVYCVDMNPETKHIKH